MPDQTPTASADLTALGQNNQQLIAAIAAQQAIQAQAQDVVGRLIAANQAVLDAFTTQQAEQAQVVQDTKTFIQTSSSVAQQLAQQLQTPLTPTPAQPNPAPIPAPATPS